MARIIITAPKEEVSPHREEVGVDVWVGQAQDVHPRDRCSGPG